MLAMKLSSSDFLVGWRKVMDGPSCYPSGFIIPVDVTISAERPQPMTKTWGSSNRQLCLEDSLSAWLHLSWNCTAFWDFLPKPPS